MVLHLIHFNMTSRASNQLTEEDFTPHFLEGRTKTCIALGVFSRTTEIELRQWHREVYYSPNTTKSWGEEVRLQLFFAVSKNSDAGIMDQMHVEQELHGDMIILDAEETYELLTAKTFEVLRALLPHVSGPECKEGYLVKFDTDVVLGYGTLVDAIKAMPSSSVYFGQMFPITPVGTERTERQISMSFMPMWAIGTMYGFSRDVVKQLVSPKVMSTVWKQAMSYIVREEDRAIGLALARGQVNVQHYLHIPGTFSACSQKFSCDRYHHAIAFNVGFGISGDRAQLFATKKKALSLFHSNVMECNRQYDSIPPGKTLFYEAKGNKTFENMTMTAVLFDGCHSIDRDGRNMLGGLTNLHEAAAAEVKMEDYQCAEKFYLASNPDVAKLVESGHYKSGRDHYISTGWKDKSLHFFCPEGCDSGKECKYDKEAAYFKSYPRVAKAVRQGRFKSGLDHFTKHPKGRSYSCYSRHDDGSTTARKDIFSEFISETYPAVSQWPIHGEEKSFDPNPARCKALLYIDGRDHEWMDYVLRVHRRYTGPDWMFYLVGTPEVAKTWRLKYDGPLVKVIEMPERFGDLSVYPDEINAFTMSDFLWKEVVECEYVLLTQSDSLLLRHGIEDFFGFSYVGAPIFPESFPTTDWRLLHAKNISSGGCGGLSFRRRSYMVKALEECVHPKTDEDVWFSSCMQELGAPLPHPTIANRFSTGSKCEVDAPLGAHQMWSNCG